MNYRAFKLDLKEVKEDGNFSGYASVFGNKDSWGDVVDRGAFAKTINDNQGKFPLLFFHNPYEPVGMSTVQEDSKGLHLEGELDLDTEPGRRTYSGLKKGYIDRMSIGYSTIKDEQEGQTRHLKEIKLWENSLVTRNFAANEFALVTEVHAVKGILREIADLPPDLDASELHAAVKALAELLEGVKSKPVEPEDSTQPTDESSEDTRLLNGFKDLDALIAEESALKRFQEFGRKLRKEL